MDFWDKKQEFINSLGLSEQDKFTLRNNKFNPLFEKIFELSEKPKVKYKYDTKVIYKPCQCETAMRRTTSVAKICLETGKELERFGSINDGAKSVNGSHSHIIANLKGECDSAYGFKWVKINRHKVCPMCKELKHTSNYRQEIVKGKIKIGGYCYPCEQWKNKYNEIRRELLKANYSDEESREVAKQCMDYKEQIKKHQFIKFVRAVAKNGILEAFEEYKKC